VCWKKNSVLEEKELVEVLSYGMSARAPDRILKTHGIRDLLDGLDVVARDELVVGVEKLDARLLERALREKETLDA
jgi:hypothetical protein